MRSWPFRLAGLPALTLLAGLGTTDAGKVVPVAIGDLAYAPADVTVHVGDTVEWLNGDFVDHSATAPDAGWDVEIPANGRAEIVMRQAGTFAYICRYHPNMTGTVRVTD